MSDFAYFRQRLDLLHWASLAASWDLDPPRRARALAAAAQEAWAGGRLDEAWELAIRGVTAAGGRDRPAAALALDVTGDLAMFAGRTDDALARYRDAARLFRTAGEQARVLISEISIAQVAAYGGRPAEARTRIRDLVTRAHQLGNPTVLSWAYCIAGLAASDIDVDGALAAYAAAIAYGSETDSQLFVMIARGSSVALAASSGEPARALEEFSQQLEQWEQLGNEAGQFWILLHLVVLLARVDAHRDAAVLAGAVHAARERHPTFAPDEAQLQTALADVRTRLGTEPTEQALAHGAALTHVTALAHARQALRSAQRLR